MNKQRFYWKRKKPSKSTLLEISIALSVAFAAATTQAFASSDLMRGMSAYQAKDYKTARAYFQRAIQSAPEDSLAHYYLGNTLLKMKDPTGAKKEYQSGSTNAETDDVKENCDKALDLLQKNDKTQTVKAGPALGSGGASMAAATPGTSTGGGGAGSDSGSARGNDAAGNPLAPRAPGATKSAVPENAATPAAEVAPEVPLTPLQKHALMEKELLKHQSEVNQKQLMETAAARAKSIEESTKRATDTSDMNYRARARSQAYMNELKSQGEKQRAQAIEYGKTRAADQAKMQAEKARAIDDVVNNLNDQMNSKVGSSKVHLRPEGTSIYIRNYGP